MELAALVEKLLHLGLREGVQAQVRILLGVLRVEGLVHHVVVYGLVFPVLG